MENGYRVTVKAPPTMNPFGWRRTTSVVGAAVLAAALAGCGGSSTPHSAPAPATSTSTSTTTTSTTVAAITTTTVAAPAGGPVPTGFTPSSVTAVSVSTMWVLGDAPCKSPPCTSLVRSTDGGAHFVGLPAPRAPLAINNQPGGPASPASVSAVRFADQRDGWIFGPGLYATHDGGENWHAVAMPGQVLDLEAAHGEVWALGGNCETNKGCTGFWLQRSPVGSDDFSPVALPVPMNGPAPAPAMSLQGASVYLLVNSVSTGQRYNSTLLVSTDGGSFSRYQAPCTVDLGGSLSAAPANLWAVCPTGMMSGVWRSTDGGATFSRVHTPVLTPNSAIAAAAGTTEAIVAIQGPRLFVTGDGGLDWAQGRIPADLTGGDVDFIGMSDASVGFALVSTQGSQSDTLLRTTDGGRQWAAVSF